MAEGVLCLGYKQSWCWLDKSVQISFDFVIMTHFIDKILCCKKINFFWAPLEIYFETEICSCCYLIWMNYKSEKHVEKMYNSFVPPYTIRIFKVWNLTTLFQLWESLIGCLIVSYSANLIQLVSSLTTSKGWRCFVLPFCV